MQLAFSKPRLRPRGFWLLACAGKVQEEEDLKCKLHKYQGTVKSFLLWNLHWRRLSLQWFYGHAHRLCI